VRTSRKPVRELLVSEGTGTPCSRQRGVPVVGNHWQGVQGTVRPRPVNAPFSQRAARIRRCRPQDCGRGMVRRMPRVARIVEINRQAWVGNHPYEVLKRMLARTGGRVKK